MEANSEYEVLWNLSDIDVDGNFHAPSMVGAPNKIIISGQPKGKMLDTTILALDSSSGNILWEVPGRIGEEITTSDNAVYRGTSGTAIVYAYNIENGELLWSTRLPWGHSTSDIYFSEKKIFADTNNSKFFVLNEQGEILDNIEETFRTFLELNGVLYMENAMGIQAVELPSKKVVWTLNIDERYTHAPVFNDGEIFLRTWKIPTYIYSIDQYTGKVNWIASQDALSNLCLVGDKIYFTNPNGYLIAVNRYSGNEISREKIFPIVNLNKQIGNYSIACDKTSNVLALSFGDNTQIMGLKILNP
jgi:outer membrane protein assembly factor BamB